jgi:acyl-CoA synthetase (AMP-forming)/AMP-acid ligase II
MREAGGSLGRLLGWRLDEGPDAGFVFVSDDGPWTYRQLAAAAVRLFDGLAGVRPGDRVVVRIGNDERFLPAITAIWNREAAVVPMHPAAPPEEVARVVAALGVTAVVADPADPCLGAVDVPVVTVDRIPVDDPGSEADRYSAPTRDVGPEPALVLLTSGSTGAPKGVVLTHDAAWSNVRATVSAFRSDTSPAPLAPHVGPAAKTPNLLANPLSHTAGVVRLIFALYVGRRIVLLRKFDGRTAKRLLDRHGIDHLTINPSMMRILLDALEPGEDLGRVRYVSSGTAPLPAALREEFEERFGVPVLQAYGQTEAFGGIAIESVKDVLAGRRRPGSVGKALPGVELRIVTPDGRDAGPGEQGEILARSRSSTAGYLGGSSADSPVDAEGWLHTGDLGHRDADGYLFITGRLKNTIICGGFNVVPEEVEAVLVADTRVRDAAVLPLPDDRLGEIPVALVEAVSGAALVADELLGTVSERLAPYKRPRRLFVLETLPRVPNGKVDRPRALELARELAAR